MAPGHDPVEMGVHLIRLAFAQLIRGGAPKAGQWLGAEPGVGGERGSGGVFASVATRLEQDVNGESALVHSGCIAKPGHGLLGFIDLLQNLGT